MNDEHYAPGPPRRPQTPIEERIVDRIGHIGASLPIRKAMRRPNDRSRATHPLQPSLPELRMTPWTRSNTFLIKVFSIIQEALLPRARDRAGIDAQLLLISAASSEAYPCSTYTMRGEQAFTKSRSSS